MNTTDRLNRLAKWRNVFTGWQLGTRAKGDPEGDAVSDHREVTLIMRAELNALVGLLIAKEVFTVEEWDDMVGLAADDLNDALAKRFPGFTASLTGITMTPEAFETTKGWKP